MGSMPRPVVAFVTAAMLVILTAPAAGGQSEEEVAEAAARAQTAAEARRQAGERTATTAGALRAAVLRYEELTAEITDVTFHLTALIEETREREEAYRTRRDEARRATTAAYIAARAGTLPPAAGATSLSDVALAAEVGARIADVRHRSIAGLETAASELDAQRTVLEDARATLAGLRDEATALVPRISALLRDARIQEVFAVDQEEAAVARYELAAAELEAALARVSPGALRWRALVERHFREEMTWAALQVLDCESGGDPDAVNELSGSTGLFQFLAGTWLFASAGAGYAGADRTEPEANVAAAAWLVARSEALAHPRGAWGHWVCQPLAP